MTTQSQPPAGGAHTPGPWRLSHQLADGFSIAHEIAPSCGLLVCVATVHNTGGQPFHGLPLNDATARANAAFIVRACNSHDDFVAIIDRVSRYLTGDCRAGDLSDLESVICDVEAVRAKHGLDAKGGAK